MNAFIVELEDRPGAVARVAGALGRASVNITTGAGIAAGGRGAFGFLTDDEAAAEAALRAAGIEFRTATVVMAAVADAAGGLAAAAQRLADAGVNVEFVVPARIGGERMGVAFGVSDAPAARAALGDLAG
jgi:hypothetical protein